MKKRTYLYLFLVGVLGLTGCSILPEQVTEHPNVIVEAVEETNYNLAVVERGDIYLTQKLFFLYSQTKEEHLTFSTEGRRVTGVYAQVGDEVEKGQLLAELYSEDLEEDLASYTYQKQRYELQNKQAGELYEYDAAGLKAKYKAGEISKGDYEERIAQRKTDYENSKKSNDDALTIVNLRIEELKEKLQGCKVYAGINGVVTFVLPRLEDSFSDEDVTVYRIINSDECLFQLEDTEYSDCFEVGQKVHLSISDKLGYDTTVKDIRQKDTDEEGEPKYIVYLEPDEIDTELEVGTRCYQSLVLDERHNVLYLPNQCVFLADGQAYVFVEDADGMKSIQYISIGMKGDSYTEITGGLEEGDIVIKK